MKRWIKRIDSSGEAPDIDLFLADLKEICIKHNMSISHEDSWGAFIIHSFCDANLRWLEEALDGR